MYKIPETQDFRYNITKGMKCSDKIGDLYAVIASIQRFTEYQDLSIFWDCYTQQYLISINNYYESIKESWKLSQYEAICFYRGYLKGFYYSQSMINKTFENLSRYNNN